MTKDWPVKWQVLETKARFINQVMNSSVTVRQAEDLEGGALTYAEIHAIASGNPAVMEKVKVDTEIRKLDQLQHPMSTSSTTPLAGQKPAGTHRAGAHIPFGSQRASSHDHHRLTSRDTVRHGL